MKRTIQQRTPQPIDKTRVVIGGALHATVLQTHFIHTGCVNVNVNEIVQVGLYAMICRIGVP
jgi:hypothetical protein